ncbi:hypothetical protein GOBAR_DD04054 [Gossypium barbadense]|nr:hypothetical protein GOBAR_DD04054 [Gossypium barbadense]
MENEKNIEERNAGPAEVNEDGKLPFWCKAQLAVADLGRGARRRRTWVASARGKGREPQGSLCCLVFGPQ